MKKLIKNILSEEINQYIEKTINCPDLIINDELIDFIEKFNSSEELLQNGGIPIEILDRLAFGFNENDIKKLHPSKLKIKWKTDLDNVKYEIKNSGLSPKKWAEKINLIEPIDVVFEKSNFYIEDGHHRYLAAKILDENLNVNLEINSNPINELSNLSYDEYHRCIFKKIKKNVV